MENSRLVGAERLGNSLTFVQLGCDSAVVLVESVVVVKGASVLRNRVQLPAQCRERAAVRGVRMRRTHGIGTGRMNARINRESSSVTGWLPSTTSPLWLTRMRSDALIRPKLMPKPFTQKVSVNSGSRAVM